VLQVILSFPVAIRVFWRSRSDTTLEVLALRQLKNLLAGDCNVPNALLVPYRLDLIHSTWRITTSMAEVRKKKGGRPRTGNSRWDVFHAAGGRSFFGGVWLRRLATIERGRSARIMALDIAEKMAERGGAILEGAITALFWSASWPAGGDSHPNRPWWGKANPYSPRKDRQSGCTLQVNRRPSPGPTAPPFLASSA
jgi:hypothetical protein